MEPLCCELPAEVKTNCCGVKPDVLNVSVQDPEPNLIDPMEGPAAGGTIITITGKDLDTATKDDVAVSIGGIACEV